MFYNRPIGLVDRPTLSITIKKAKKNLKDAKIFVFNPNKPNRIEEKKNNRNLFLNNYFNAAFLSTTFFFVLIIDFQVCVVIIRITQNHYIEETRTEI